MSVKKILVPTIDWPTNSDAAYRVAELANSINANIIVLFVVSKMSGDSYQRGNLSIELFEEAAQNYDIEVDGYIMTGEACDLIADMAQKMEVDMILLGTAEDHDWDEWIINLNSATSCPIQLLDSIH